MARSPGPYPWAVGVMGKYAPLQGHLRAFDSDVHATAELTFAEIAELVDGLPVSAYSSRQWWANSSNTQAQSWREAGWHVDVVNFDRQRVRFARGVVGGSYLGRGRQSSSAVVGAMLVAERESAELDVQVRLTWQGAAQVTLDDTGELVFPEMPRAPGVYRLTLSKASANDRPHVYVGESQDLRRRAGQYRRPGPTQQTSQRIHDELRRHLHGGGMVTVAVASAATITARGKSADLPLGRKTARVLAEHAVLALIYLSGDAVVINRDKGTEPL